MGILNQDNNEFITTDELLKQIQETISTLEYLQDTVVKYEYDEEDNRELQKLIEFWKEYEYYITPQRWLNSIPYYVITNKETN